MANKPDYLVAKESFAYTDKDGVRRHVTAGQAVKKDDAVVKGHEGYFRPIEESIEQATAAPGEYRRTRRRVRFPKPEASDGLLEELTVAQLKEKAKGLEIDGYSQMKKAELIAALESVQPEVAGASDEQLEEDGSQGAEDEEPQGLTTEDLPPTEE